MCLESRHGHAAGHHHEHSSHQHKSPTGLRVHRRDFLGAMAMLLPAMKLRAQTKGSAAPQVDGALADAANRFLAALRPELRQKYQFAFDDPYRKDWNNLPHWIHPRKGLMLGSLNPQEKTAAHRLIREMMSSQGYSKAEVIMGILDEFLGAQDEASKNRYGSEFYFLDVFGKPGGDEPWGIKLDGHHLSLDVAVIDHNITMTPMHMGADPAVVPSGRHAGWAALGGETAKGFAMRNVLTADQAKRAVLSENVPGDIFTLPGRDDELRTPAGVSALQGRQRDALEALIDEYIGNMRAEVARSYKQAIQSAGFDKVHFAWMGPSEIGKAVYYRVHGPAILIEYDNVTPPLTKLPNDPNHIHTVCRSPMNDYGDDWLRRHYQEHHTGQ